MANPQIEDGHVDLANEIVEALAQQVLSPDEWRVLMVIFRKTYGWHKKQDWISHGQFAEMTGIARHHVPRILNKLIKRNIIIKGVTQTGNTNNITYQFQKNFDKWVVLPRQVTVLPKQDKGVTCSGTGVLPKQVHTKETLTKENIQKKIYGEFQNVPLSEDQYQKLVKKFGEPGTKERIEILSEGIASKGYKYKDFYAAILSWERKGLKNKPKQIVTDYPKYETPKWMKEAGIDKAIDQSFKIP